MFWAVVLFLLVWLAGRHTRVQLQLRKIPVYSENQYDPTPTERERRDA